jgi:hypothetical protein
MDSFNKFFLTTDYNPYSNKIELVHHKISIQLLNNHMKFMIDLLDPHWKHKLKPKRDDHDGLNCSFFDNWL